MVDASTHFVTWASRRRRHGGATAADIGTPPPPSSLAPGDTFYPPWAPPAISWTDGMGHAHNATFAFWSVTGGTDGATASTQNPPPPAKVGGTNIDAKAWYIEGGGGGNGGPGIYIDAFDVEIGDFVDDDFVTVVPDAGLTAAANEDGFVPTNNLEDINAFSSIHAVPFDDWEVVAGMEAVNNEDLTAAEDTSAIAFAFYHKPPNSGFKHIDVPSLGTWVSYGVMVDGGGPTGNGPVPPWSPYLRQIAAGMAIAEAAEMIDPKLKSSALDLAAKQVGLAAQGMQKQMQAEAKGH